MYEITRSERDINGVKVETWKAEIVNANIIEVEVGTTGYCGGDTGLVVEHIFEFKIQHRRI